MHNTKVKIFEALDLIDSGADGLDGVINYQALRSGDRDYVKRELTEIVEEAHKAKPDIEIKFIIEVTLLTSKKMIAAAKLVKESGADFGIKAAGGHIATTEKALSMLEAGANIIGENNCCQIMEGYDLLMEKRSRR